MIALLCIAALAVAGPSSGLDGARGAEPSDVVLEVASGVDVNWTRLVLVARASARSHGTEDIKAVEELARREIQLGMDQGARRLDVTTDHALGDLFEDREIGRALRSRVARWEVSEARYHASGKVELVAELALQDLFRPWSVSRVRTAAADPPAPRYTGLVIDARGLSAKPGWSPRILAPDGAVLHEATLWEEAAVSLAPLIYVSDPAHPAAVRAGQEPLFVRAAEASGVDLVLSDEEAVRFASEMSGARVLGEGTVVVVIDAAGRPDR